MNRNVTKYTVYTWCSGFTETSDR